MSIYQLVNLDVMSTLIKCYHLRSYEATVLL